MVKPKFVKMALFWLVTWTIYNSLPVCVVIYELGSGKWQSAWRDFYEIYCMNIIIHYLPGILIGLPGLVIGLLDYRNWEYAIENSDGWGILFFLLAVAYEVGIAGGALRTWWRNQSVFAAFVLALAGIVTSPAILVMHHVACFWFMVGLYALLGFWDILQKEYGWPKLDISKSLIWRRPWT